MKSVRETVLGSLIGNKWRCINFFFVVSIFICYHLKLITPEIFQGYRLQVKLIKLAPDGTDIVEESESYDACLELQAGQKGSTRCGVGDVGWANRSALPVQIFQLFHSRDTFSELYDCTHPLYRGVAQTPGVLRKGYNDIDATAVLELAKERPIQNNLCEYTSLFSLAASGYLDDLGNNYAGTQSWRAVSKGYFMTCLGEWGLVNNIWDQRSQGRDAFIYWGGLGPEWTGGVAMRFYDYSAEVHSPAILAVQKEVFQKLFGGNVTEGLDHNGLPPMPDDGQPWAYMSYFAMPAPLLKEYLFFAAHFWAVLAEKWEAVFMDPFKCPVMDARPLYSGQHCFCFIMERLVNIWVYHKGIPFLHLNGMDGGVFERHPIKERQMLPWFTNGGLEASLQAVQAWDINRRAKVYLRQLLVGNQASGVSDA